VRPRAAFLQAGVTAFPIGVDFYEAIGEIEDKAPSLWVQVNQIAYAAVGDTGLVAVSTSTLRFTSSLSEVQLSTPSNATGRSTRGCDWLAVRRVPDSSRRACRVYPYRGAP
jgi:hypothetical protein